MAEYAKKTVAELQEILKSRGLPSSGKKAELIARLNENDKELAGKFWPIFTYHRDLTTPDTIREKLLMKRDQR